jgi:hypothetical protein
LSNPNLCDENYPTVECAALPGVVIFELRWAYIAERREPPKQAKTFASELETLGRNNPLGAMAAAMMVGVLIGLIGRGRT